MRRYRRAVLVEPKAPGYHVYNHARLPRLGFPTLWASLKRVGCVLQCLLLVLKPSLQSLVLAAGWHVVMGKWKRAWHRLARTAPVMSAIARAYGWFHLRRWKQQNRNFLKWLSTSRCVAANSRSNRR